MSKKILVTDDEFKLVDMVSTYLTNEGYTVIAASNGKQAIEAVKVEKPDLVILDWMMPDLSGIEALKELRKVTQVPVIMLTAKADEIDKLVGLEVGADDYITKPFSLRELAARVKALLRRSVNQAEPIMPALLRAGSLTLGLADYQVRIGGEQINDLTPTEFKLLGLLVRNPGRVFTRMQLLEHIAGEAYEAYEGYERSLDTHVSNLRKKIRAKHPGAPHIKTVHGIGYKLELGDNRNETGC